MARLGIRNFKPILRKAAERLATVHTPEGVPLPPNTLAELHRDMARLGFVVSQIRDIEDARQKRLQQQHETGSHAMVRRLGRIVGGIATPAPCPMTWLGAMSFSTQLTKASKSKSLLWHTPVMLK